jgi:hypothetical protein
MTDWRDIVKLVESKHISKQFPSPSFNDNSSTPTSISLAGLSLSSKQPFAALQPLSSPTLRAPFDSILSLSSNTPSQTPSPPPRGPDFTELRHPLTLPLSTVSTLISDRCLPPTLVHQPYLLPQSEALKRLAEDEEGEEVRLFWFVPDRLDEVKLKGLARAVKKWEGRGEGWWGEGDKGKEVVETGEWLIKYHGE